MLLCFRYNSIWHPHYLYYLSIPKNFPEQVKNVYPIRELDIFLKAEKMIVLTYIDGIYYKSKASLISFLRLFALKSERMYKNFNPA